MVGGGLGATHLTTAMQLETDATNVTCLFHYMQLAQNNPPDRRNTLTNLTTTVGENNMFFTSICRITRTEPSFANGKSVAHASYPHSL